MSPGPSSGASAVVLAGGRSSRFGSDKLMADLEGSPLVHRALHAAAGVCDEVVVVVAPIGRIPLPADLIPPVVVVRDEVVHPGPLAALLAGARAATGARLLVVAGDMPGLLPAVLARLLDWHDGQGACLVVRGERQVLPLAVGRDAAIGAAELLLGSGQRSLRAFVSSLDLEMIEEPEWRALDPDGSSLRDVDRPEDLAPLR